MSKRPGPATKPKNARRKKKSSPPPSADPGPARPDPGADGAGRQRPRARQPYARALASGTLVALAAALLVGTLRTQLWILGLEPLAVGVVIGETSAIPSSARHRRPPAWSYLYVIGLGGLTYVAVHVVHWLVSVGPLPAQSFLDFLRSAPSATAVPFFQSVDLARQISLATGGASALKYWIWIGEALVLAAAAVLAYRGASVRRLKT